MINLVVGIGKKARQGKDFSALVLKKALEPYFLVKILPLSVALKEELREYPDYPLITLEKDVFSFRDVRKSGASHYHKISSELPAMQPFLREFEKRKINKFFPTEEKDPIMLQLWGTDYRRKFFSEDFWIDKLFEKLEKVSRVPRDTIIIIPDIRFRNEFQAMNSAFQDYFCFVEVKRLMPDGSLFLDPNRDSSHPSENDLNSISVSSCNHYYEVSANDGDLSGLRTKVMDLSETLIGLAYGNLLLSQGTVFDKLPYSTYKKKV